VACETACTTGMILVMGEITSKANVDIQKLGNFNQFPAFLEQFPCLLRPGVWCPCQASPPLIRFVFEFSSFEEKSAARL
jgi:hypothetical protein